MTGYGSYTVTLKDKVANIEMRTLNSKGLDMNLKLSPSLRAYEVALRNLVSEKIMRGKTDLSIRVEWQEGHVPMQINKPLLLTVLKELNTISEENAIAAPDLLSIAFRMPNIIESNEEMISEEEWNEIKSGVELSIKQLQQFRADEGISLEKDFDKRVAIISGLLLEIEKNDTKRPEKIKQRLQENLTALLGDVGFDKSRLEQEMIFYLEKLDITEEVVRLKSHFEYFLSTIKNSDAEKGKKLNFIAQEIGREINTIGSKANDADIQKSVVQMKDELEKIKEQLNNVL